MQGKTKFDTVQIFSKNIYYLTFNSEKKLTSIRLKQINLKICQIKCENPIWRA